MCAFCSFIIFSLSTQFDAEFRRWSVKRSEATNFEDFSKLVERLHQLNNMEFLISYVDPSDNDLLPINNDDNFGRAMSTAKPLLRVIVQRKGMLPQSIVCDAELHCLHQPFDNNNDK